MNRFLELGLSLLVQSALLLALGLALTALLRRRGPLLRSFVLHMTLAGVVLEALLSVGLTGRVQPLWTVSLPTAPAPLTRPAPPLPLPPLAAPPVSAPPQAASPAPAPQAATVPPVQATHQNWQERLWQHGALLIWLWLTGTVLGLLWLILCQWHLARLARRATVLTTGPVTVLLADLAAARGVRPPRLRVSPDVRSPFLAGLRQPSLFLPASWETDYDEAALHVICAHELAHHTRRDLGWTLLLRLTTALLWPQPLLWLLARQLDQATEEACDLLALSSHLSPRRYADSLLALADHALPAPAERSLGAGIVTQRSALSRRIHNILNRRTQTMSPISFRASLAIACGMAAATFVSLCLVSVADTPGTIQAEKAQAMQITSVSNLRQIGLACMTYAQDHGGHLPNAAHWTDEVLPYLLQGATSNAERQDRTRLLFHDPAAPVGDVWSYAYNAALSGAALVTLKDPAHLALVFESQQGVKNASDNGQSIPHPGWHGGIVNVCSADGKVQSLPDTTVHSTLTFQPSKQATVHQVPVTGILYDRRTHQPLAGITVFFAWPGSVTPPPSTIVENTNINGVFHDYLLPGDNYLFAMPIKAQELKSDNIRFNPTDPAAGPVQATYTGTDGITKSALSPDTYTVVLTVPHGFAVQTVAGPAAINVIPEQQMKNGKPVRLSTASPAP